MENQSVVIRNEALTEAACIKSATITSYELDRVDHEKFCGAWEKFMGHVNDSEFWTAGTEQYRDFVFAHFSLVYLLHCAKNDDELRGAARMFQQAKERFTAFSLRVIEREFEINIKAQGFKFIGMDKGIKQYRQVRKSPKRKKVE